MKKLLALFAIGLLLTASSFAALTGGLNKYAQVVNVSPSGGQFTSIQSAINSITDASATKSYAVQVQSGIYNESITMKEYVDLVGVDRDSCIITQADATVITPASNSGLFNLSMKVTAPTAARAVILTALDLSNFTVKDCYIENITGNYSHDGLSLGQDGKTISNIRIENNIIKNGQGNYGNRGVGLFAETYGQGTNIITGNTITSPYGVWVGSFGFTATDYVVASNNILKNNNGVSPEMGVTVYSGHTYGKLKSYNNILDANYELTAGTGAAATIEAYGDSGGTGVTSLSVGTKTFNSYGSVVGTTLTNKGIIQLETDSTTLTGLNGALQYNANGYAYLIGGTNGLRLRGITSAGQATITDTAFQSDVPFQTKVVATTPDAYALTSNTAGSMVYVTSARKMYIRGFATWEAISSAP
jgi:hypothetical protein